MKENIYFQLASKNFKKIGNEKHLTYTFVNETF